MLTLEKQTKSKEHSEFALKTQRENTSDPFPSLASHIDEDANLGVKEGTLVTPLVPLT